MTATFLDVSGLEYFTNIFVFLFVWIVVYAVFLWTKILGENKFINAIVGLLLAIFVVISKLATSIVADIAPFLAVVFVFIILISVTSKTLGADIEGFPGFRAIALVFIVIIVIAGASLKIREKVNIESPSNDLSKTVNLIFHPTFLGMVLIFAIAVFTIALLTSKSI